MAALKAGWQDLGNGLVQNKNVYGGAVDVNNPIYANAPDGPQPIDHGPVGQAVGAPVNTGKDVTQTSATVGQTTPQGQPTTVGQSFQQMLINRLNPTAVSASSPEVAPAIQANKLMEQRALERNRGLLASRAAQQGYSGGGAFDTQLLGLAQDRAQREGQFAGNAVQRANEIQNQNATNALGTVNALLNAQMANDTQLHGIDTQANLGLQDIGLRRELGTNANNLSLLGLLLNNDQFGRSLGQQGAQFGASLDQSGLLGLLGLL